MMTLMFSLLVLAGPAADGDEIDHLALAALLMRDGHAERAQIELAKVNPKGEEVDRFQLWLLKGIASLRLKQPQSALVFLSRALEVKEDPQVHLLRAQAGAQLKRWDVVVEALDGAGSLSFRDPKLLIMRGTALLKLKRFGEAYALTERQLQHHPAAIGLVTIQVQALIGLQLYNSAAERALSMVTRAELTPRDGLRLVDSLRRAKRLDQALRCVEALTMRFPDDREVALLHARLLLKAKRVQAAANRLERAAWVDPSLASDAAELFRRAGNWTRARAWNARIQDPATKLNQRLGLLVSAERFDEVMALRHRLQRLGLGNDDKVRYALAFSAFRTGAFDQVDSLLEGIMSESVFEQAIELRRAASQCQVDPAGCL